MFCYLRSTVTVRYNYETYRQYKSWLGVCVWSKSIAASKVHDFYNWSVYDAEALKPAGYTYNLNIVTAADLGTSGGQGEWVGSCLFLEKRRSACIFFSDFRTEITALIGLKLFLNE